MINKTAFFTGHRHIDNKNIPKLKINLKKLIINLISKGVIYFGNGGAYGFDLIAANIVIDLRKEYQQIKLIMILPCKNQTKYWKAKHIKEYNHILYLADKIVYTSENYHSRCMLDRNDHMINNSKYCIAYCNKNTGGTFYTINKSLSKNLTVFNLSND